MGLLVRLMSLSIEYREGCSMLELVMFINYADGEIEQSILESENFTKEGLFIMKDKLEVVRKTIRQFYLGHKIEKSISNISVMLVGVYNQFDREVLNSIEFDNLEKMH